ncbi:MAG: hypothetical protein GXY64_00785 [Bacteroidales bacterium]|nr:hypothetical protein [Bacteroidales bacterium]
MRIFRYFILLLFFSTGQSSSSQTNQVREKELETVLAELDHVIANKRSYQDRRQALADSLEREIGFSTPNQFIPTCKRLYDAVCDYDGRQTLKVLDRIKNSGFYQSDPDLHVWTDLNTSRVYAVMGLFNESSAITDSIHPDTLSKEELLHYHFICRENYKIINEYRTNISITTEEEAQMRRLYNNIMQSLTEGGKRDYVSAERDIYFNRNPRKALANLKRLLPMANQDERYCIFFQMAAASKLIDRTNDEIYYLAKSAILDISRGDTKYEALPHLVMALYEKGDIERAYSYLMCVMEDANRYPSQRLALNVSAYFPIINQSYSLHKAYLEEERVMKRNSLVITLIFLSFALAGVVYLGWRKSRLSKERQRANQLQKALDQATIADRVKTVFIQNMRHEIRTPLNAIVGFAQLMSNDLSQEERSLYNGYIRENNDKLLCTLDDIIDVSNMEVGTFNFHFEEIDIDQLCKNYIDGVKEKVNEGVQCIYNPMQRGLRITSDKKRIGQVLYNLLTNACKNTTSGKIVLNVASHSGSGVQFILTDTGSGIPIEKADVIFQHFEKLDHYSPGLGLGLYVCRLIARALGGDICLDTLYTEGARFVFTIPNHVMKAEAEAEGNVKFSMPKKEVLTLKS